MRKFLSSSKFIHFLVALGLFALLGALMQSITILYFFATLSFAGAICGAFIKVIDVNRNNQ